MNFVHDARWHLPPKEAIAFQRELAPQVSLEDGLERWDLVAGIDLAFGRFSKEGRAAIVVWRPAEGEVVESLWIEAPVTLPYIPGLLAFREGPLIEQALKQMKSEPDILLFDGQGIAHPRRLGIAAHIGVLLDRPTLGVGKTRLYGSHDEPGPEPGDYTALITPDREQIGTVVRSRIGSKPLYVSPGHHISVGRATEVVVSCLRGHRLPEPLHLADRLSKDKPLDPL